MSSSGTKLPRHRPLDTRAKVFAGSPSPKAVGLTALLSRRRTRTAQATNDNFTRVLTVTPRDCLPAMRQPSASRPGQPSEGRARRARHLVPGVRRLAGLTPLRRRLNRT